MPYRMMLQNLTIVKSWIISWSLVAFDQSGILSNIFLTIPTYQEAMIFILDVSIKLLTIVSLVTAIYLTIAQTLKVKKIQNNDTNVKQ